MKCANPECSCGIGFAAYRSNWFSAWRYCLKRCRGAVVAERLKRSRRDRDVPIYFEWLFAQPVGIRSQSQSRRGIPRVTIRL
jgi:hypothetical protein